MSPSFYLPPVSVLSQGQPLFLETHSYSVTLLSCIVNLFLSIGSFLSTSNMLCLPPLKTLVYVLIFLHVCRTEFLETVDYTCCHQLLFHSLLDPLQSHRHLPYSLESILLKSWMIFMLLNLTIISESSSYLADWQIFMQLLTFSLQYSSFLASSILYSVFLPTSLATTLQSLLICSCICPSP